MELSFKSGCDPWVVLNCECNVLSGVRRPKPNAVILLAHLMMHVNHFHRMGPAFECSEAALESMNSSCTMNDCLHSSLSPCKARITLPLVGHALSCCSFTCGQEHKVSTGDGGRDGLMQLSHPSDSSHRMIIPQPRKKPKLMAPPITDTGKMRTLR